MIGATGLQEPFHEHLSDILLNSGFEQKGHISILDIIEIDQIKRNSMVILMKGR